MKARKLEKMPPASNPLVLVVVAVVVLSAAAVFGSGGKSLTLTLERASQNGLEMSELRDRDRLRHGRILQQQPTGVLDFPVEGTYDPFLVGYNFSLFYKYRFMYMSMCMYTRIDGIYRNGFYLNHHKKQRYGKGIDGFLACVYIYIL